MANPDQPKMPKYEYQAIDTRSFSVGIRAAGTGRAVLGAGRFVTVPDELQRIMRENSQAAEAIIKG